MSIYEQRIETDESTVFDTPVSIGVEDLYQAFKDRLLKELAYKQVTTIDCDGENVLGYASLTDVTKEKQSDNSFIYTR